MATADVSAVRQGSASYRPARSAPDKTYLDEVCALDDPRQRGRALTANYAGCWRYRIGDWRVIAEIRDDDLVIVAIGLGHRSEVFEIGSGMQRSVVGSAQILGEPFRSGRGPT